MDGDLFTKLGAGIAAIGAGGVAPAITATPLLTQTQK